MTKKLLRKEMMKKRDSFDDKTIKSLSSSIINSLKATEEYKNAKNIFVFVSAGSEVITHEFIIDALDSGKNISAPFVDPQERIMYATNLKNFEDLELGHYNILALPEDKLEIIKPEEIDLIIVPGLIFGKNFYRIGYGGGYYDKFMSNENFKATKIGICFDFQLVDHVKYDLYDIAVDMVITDKRKLEGKNNE